MFLLFVLLLVEGNNSAASGSRREQKKRKDIERHCTRVLLCLLTLATESSLTSVDFSSLATLKLIRRQLDRLSDTSARKKKHRKWTEFREVNAKKKVSVIGRTAGGAQLCVGSAGHDVNSENLGLLDVTTATILN